MADKDYTVTGRSYVKPAAKPEIMKPAGMAKPDANPWHPVTDPCPEGKVLEIDGYDGNAPELAVKSGGCGTVTLRARRPKLLLR